MIFPDKCPGKRCLPHSPASSSAPIGGVIGVRQFCFLHFSFGGEKKKTCLAWQSFQLKGHTLTAFHHPSWTANWFQSGGSILHSSGSAQAWKSPTSWAAYCCRKPVQNSTTYSKSWTLDEQVDSQNAPEISSIISPMGLFWSLWEHWWIFPVKLIKYHNDW